VFEARYAAPMEETVVVKVVDDEPEAQIVCGLLRSNGIECGYRDTEQIESSLEDFTASGPREIFVHASDLEAAQALLGEGEG
jgi:putative signal transducing protein